MPVITRSQMMRELEPGLNAIFGANYKRYPEEHKDIFKVETSERAFEEELKIALFGAAPIKNEGQALTYDAAQEAWVARYNHETIALGFAITEEAIEDNLYVSLSKRYTEALAHSMAYTKQTKGASILNNAFNSSYKGGDGKPLCATDHPTVSGYTNANKSSTGADLNETSLEAATITIAGWRDERGLLIAAKPKRLIIPVNLMYVATRILETELRTGTADNDINALRTNGAIPEGYRVNHYLTDPDNWFIITDIPNGLKCFQRAPLKTAMEGDFDTGNVRYKARERYSFGWSDPLGIYGENP